MGLLSILEKGIKAMIDEAFTPESFKIGERFEDYIRDKIFIEKYYDIIERTHNYQSNSKDYVESSLKPDFLFRDRWNKKEFYVEAKFRTGLNNGKIKWCNENQLKRYRQINKDKPVFIIIGFGDDPKQPEFLTLLTIDAAKYIGLFPSYVEQYKIFVDKPIPSKILWGR
jgi:hypothetical protein